MEHDKNKDTELEKKNNADTEKSWIDKADKFIDETADKIHESEGYKKADKSFEDATKSIFRKAGSLWGKSEHYFKNKK